MSKCSWNSPVDSHDWEEVDSMYNNDNFTDVVCKICRVPGEKTNKTGEIFFPAT